MNAPDTCDFCDLPPVAGYARYNLDGLPISLTWHCARHELSARAWLSTGGGRG